MLGVCLGLQVAVIEFARNVLGWEGEAAQIVQHLLVLFSSFLWHCPNFWDRRSVNRVEYCRRTHAHTHTHTHAHVYCLLVLCSPVKCCICTARYFVPVHMYVRTCVATSSILLPHLPVGLTYTSTHLSSVFVCLSVCLTPPLHPLAVYVFADANSTEFHPDTKHPVVSGACLTLCVVGEASPCALHGELTYSSFE